ncbi:DnaB-like helicase N-terminal domain-containing protein [Gordonia hongkongensis]|uniref:DNA helicase n=1 Tax=Gordonia hongkongensis TaxID=1701090 RepID=A0ABT6BYU2_9ACTN|nr:DnaB-like helicase N-terminal domain-containing protein [Gordonia hongkongensis]MDF6103088.1 DNA helicase [Gordonia hongkongensis]
MPAATPPDPSVNAAAHDDAALTDGDGWASDTGHAEVLLLSALLWATPAHHDELADIVGLVRAEDFYVQAHGELFTIIAELIADGTRRAHDATTVAHELRRQGRAATLGAERLTRALVAATSAGADGIQARHYAAMVVADAYRRRYRAAGDGITHAADHLPEAELWDYMCAHGIALREHRTRLSALRPN